MYPILGRYGSFFLYSYTVCFGVALLLSWLWLRRRTINENNTLALLAVSIIALLVGRAAFIFANWDYYADRSAEIWLLGQGGLAAQPILMTLLLGLGLYFWLTKQKPFWGALAIPLTIFYMSGWLACYLEGCAYGLETTLHPLAADLPDNFGVFALRYQTQLIGFTGATLTFLAAIYCERRVGDHPRCFWRLLAILLLQQLAILFWRADPVPHWLGWRADGWLILLTLFLTLPYLLKRAPE